MVHKHEVEVNVINNYTLSLHHPCYPSTGANMTESIDSIQTLLINPQAQYELGQMYELEEVLDKTIQRRWLLY